MRLLLGRAVTAVWEMLTHWKGRSRGERATGRRGQGRQKTAGRRYASKTSKFETHVHNGEILRAWDRYPVSAASVGEDKAKIGKGKNAWAGREVGER